MSGWKLYPYEGEMLTLGEISQRTGINQKTLQSRLKRGMDVCRAANMPTQLGNKPVHYEFNGKEYTLSELAELSGVKKQTISWRLHQGETVAEAIRPPRPSAPRRKLTEEEKAVRRKPHTPERIDRRRAAAQIIEMLVNGAGRRLKRLDDGYMYSGGLCVYSVTFPREGRAMLKVYLRRIGGMIMCRHYELDEYGVREAAG